MGFPGKWKFGPKPAYPQPKWDPVGFDQPLLFNFAPPPNEAGPLSLALAAQAPPARGRGPAPAVARGRRPAVPRRGAPAGPWPG